MQHLYRTAEDLQDQHPVCAEGEPAHSIKPDPVCARCLSWQVEALRAERDARSAERDALAANGQVVEVTAGGGAVA